MESENAPFVDMVMMFAAFFVFSMGMNRTYCVFLKFCDGRKGIWECAPLLWTLCHFLVGEQGSVQEFT